MTDAVQIPEATTVFQTSEGAFEADPFELWEAIQKLANESVERQKNDPNESDFSYFRAIRDHIKATYDATISLKQAAWFSKNIGAICTEKKSDSSPSSDPSAAPAASMASPSSDSPAPNEEY